MNVIKGKCADLRTLEYIWTIQVQRKQISDGNKLNVTSLSIQVGVVT